MSLPAEPQTYDWIVIGGGPAGEKGAAQAAYFGKRVALIEREPWLGGAAVNTGTLRMRRSGCGGGLAFADEAVMGGVDPPGVRGRCLEGSSLRWAHDDHRNRD